MLIFACPQSWSPKACDIFTAHIMHVCCAFLSMGITTLPLNLAMLSVFIMLYFIWHCWWVGNRGNNRLIRSSLSSFLSFSFTAYFTLHWLRNICIFFLIFLLPISKHLRGETVFYESFHFPLL